MASKKSRFQDMGLKNRSTIFKVFSKNTTFRKKMLTNNSAYLQKGRYIMILAISPTPCSTLLTGGKHASSEHTNIYFLS